MNSQVSKRKREGVVSNLKNTRVSHGNDYRLSKFLFNSLRLPNFLFNLTNIRQLRDCFSVYSSIIEQYVLFLENPIHRLGERHGYSSKG